MVVVGDMAKTENLRPGEYEFKKFTAEFDTAANILGEVYLVIGTDSGFEATTSYYLDELEGRNRPAVISQDEREEIIGGFINSLATRSDTGLRVSDATIRKIRAMAVENGYLRPASGGGA